MKGVYIVSAEGTPRIKIGWASNVDKRLRALKTGCPYPIKLLHVIETENSMTERWLHKILDTYRVHGEWFELSDTRLEMIKGLTDRDIVGAHTAEYLLAKDLSQLPDEIDAAQLEQDMIELLYKVGLKPTRIQINGR